MSSIYKQILYKLGECGFPGGSKGKNSPARQELQESWVQSLEQEEPLEEEWLPTLVFFLENPMDHGAWQAHGIAKSQTQPK